MDAVALRRKFIRPLRHKLWNVVTSHHFATLAEAVESALAVEHETERQRDVQGKGKALARSSSSGDHRGGYGYCTRPQAGGQGKPAETVTSDTTKVYAIGQRGAGVEGTILVYDLFATVLFDTGATLSFMSSSVVRVLGLTPTPLTRYLCVSSPLGVSIELGTLCDACPIVISGREFLASLIVIPDRSYDVILGVDWLRPNHALIDCFDMVVSFHVLGQPSFR
uniref:uncharacterized protein LOC105350864 n=1 Tax=Fragaria vesca subsp. vesca TaxID=101020 RepID=UPI0005CB743E|nr:PREDICTED: uncharacterized protein LOC105350864 [Fragaria vesca subsp. vesca]